MSNFVYANGQSIIDLDRVAQLERHDIKTIYFREGASVAVWDFETAQETEKVWRALIVKCINDCPAASKLPMNEVEAKLPHLFE